MIDTVSINFKISGTKIFLPFRSICSITNKEFSGEIVIEYFPINKVLEYVDTARVVKEITKSGKTTAEELTSNIFNQVKESIRPKYLKITVDVKKSKAHQPVQVWIEK